MRFIIKSRAASIFYFLKSAKLMARMGSFFESREKNLLDSENSEEKDRQLYEKLFTRG